MTLFVILYQSALILCAALCLIGFYLRARKLPVPAVFLQCCKSGEQKDDEDIKIAVPSPVSSSPLEPSDEEIHLYFYHKQSNNLALARQIGETFGKQILLFCPSSQTIPLSDEQIILTKMLYLFTAEECLHQSVADPILLKTALSRMNDTISQTLPNFYGSSYQSRSYTVYKLCSEKNRPFDKKAEEIGKCWADIVGKSNCPLYCQFGCELYLFFYRRCRSLLHSEKFSPIVQKNPMIEKGKSL